MEATSTTKKNVKIQTQYFFCEPLPVSENDINCHIIKKWDIFQTINGQSGRINEGILIEHDNGEYKVIHYPGNVPPSYGICYYFTKRQVKFSQVK